MRLLCYNAISSVSVMIKPQSGFTFVSSFLGLVISLFIVVMASSNIMHFGLEDHFHIPTDYSLIFGVGYARSQSWLLISCISAIIFGVIQKKTADNQPNFYQRKSRLVILNTLLVCSFLFGFFYIVAVIYQYFSGKTEPAGMYRILITMGTLILSTLFVFFERKQDEQTSFKKYISLICLFSVFFTGIGTLLTYQYASPKLMQLAREDVKTLLNLSDIINDINTYYKRNGNLPANLSDLNRNKASIEQQGEYYKKFTYRKTNITNYELCFDLNVASYDARRSLPYPYSPNFKGDYQKGKQCTTYKVSKNKEGISRSELINNNITVSLNIGKS